MVSISVLTVRHLILCDLNLIQCMPWSAVTHCSLAVTVYSFIPAISIAPLQVLYYSEGAPDYSTDTALEFHAEAHRQLQVKDLPKVPTWRLERESNPRPSG